MSYTKGHKRRRTTYTKFQSARGMSEVRHTMEVFNSIQKRGEIERADEIAYTRFVICGCGAPGCGFVSVTRRDERRA